MKVNKGSLIAWVIMVIAATLIVRRCDSKCAKRHCENGQVARYISAECICVTEAKP